MRTYLHDGTIVTRTAPLGGVISGVPVLIGAELLVPVSTAAAGERFAAVRVGCCRLPSKTGEAYSEGDRVYWDNSHKYCVATSAEGLYMIGTAEGPASNGHVDVCLLGIATPVHVGGGGGGGE
jgi:predicted RecA/RadA family phage recombinase